MAVNPLDVLFIDKHNLERRKCITCGRVFNPLRRHKSLPALTNNARLWRMYFCDKCMDNWKLDNEGVIVWQK